MDALEIRCSEACELGLASRRFLHSRCNGKPGGLRGLRNALHMLAGTRFVALPNQKTGKERSQDSSHAKCAWDANALGCATVP